MIPPVLLVTSTDPDVQTLVGADGVHVDHPREGRTWPLLLLTAGPNTATPAYADVAAAARVTVEGFGATERDSHTAFEVAGAAWRALLSLAGYTDAELHIARVEQAVGIRPLPLDEHRRARQACDVVIYAHRVG